MPWVPDHFSARAYEAIRRGRRREELQRLPWYDGLLTGEASAMARSFAGPPIVDDPRRGRVSGHHAFDEYVAEQYAWLTGASASVEPVALLLTAGRTIEEVVVRLHGEADADLPVAIVVDRDRDGGLVEARVYHSAWPLTGGHAVREPVLPRSEEAKLPDDFVGAYHRALATGDAGAIVATFEPDAEAREPAGGEFRYRGTARLQEFYGRLLAEGGIDLHHCTVTDNGNAVALEYNAVRWGNTDIPPQAGVAVYVRGASGKLSAARIYDDVDPPLA